jgi:dynein heavy chain, axonemal
MSDEMRTLAGAQCMLFHSGVRALTERYAHEAKRHFYITPTSYLQLLNAYKSLYARKNHEVSAAKRRYENGLEKLLFTEDQVHTMKQELEVLKPQLVQASEETDALLVNVEKETIEADKVKAVVSIDEAKAKEEAQKVTAIKEECEADLAEALPALNAAIKALDTLTKNDISEVRSQTLQQE